MNTDRFSHAVSYIREEILKLSLFLVLLYGFVFGILQPPNQNPIPASSIVIPAEGADEGSIVSASLQPNLIHIPILDVSAPLSLVESTATEDFIQPLQKGTALFPSALPGQDGTAIILGHSAPLGWPRINYDWVFSDLQKLSQGDKIMVTFKNTDYTYSVQETTILQRGQEIPAKYLSEDASHLFLISCWPPGIDNKRIGVYAELTN